LDLPIFKLLQESNRIWTPKAPADEVEIAELQKQVPFELPEEYIELLRYCNGGYGELNAPPLLFQMDSIAESLDHNLMWRKEENFTDFWFIGGNGGMETIGFDLRGGSPLPLVMIDCIAGEESAQQIAVDMSNFIMKIGIKAEVSEE
jgi:hypothetical protein